MNHRRSREPHSGMEWLRQAVDLSACFLLAVILLRGLVLEGYLISTGSMAPGLLGFHKRIVCPSCQQTFAFGVAFDDSVESGRLSATPADGRRSYATCPNCGQTSIDVTDVPISHGDQLLVQKHVYDFRRPRRWEIVVFRNPASPREAYVKRVVGLPGELLQVVDGDVYINGEPARKDYDAQLSLRIPVCDIHHLAESPQWELPWLPGDGWELQGDLLTTAGDESSAPSDKPRDAESHQRNRSGDDRDSAVAWLSFRNWLLSGGHHFVETPLSRSDAEPDWQQFLDRFDRIPVSWVSRITYDPAREVLRCEGVMPAEMQQDLTTQAVNEGFRRAVYRLAALSHLAPVKDRYGYNSLVSAPEYEVSDLMLRAVLSWDEPPSEILVRAPVDSEVFEILLRPRSGELFVIRAGSDTPVQQASFTPSPVEGFPPGVRRSSGVELEVSNFDRQLLVAINGRQVLQPWPVPTRHDNPGSRTIDSPQAANSRSLPGPGTALDTRTPAEKATETGILREQQSRWKLGVRGMHVRLEHLQMFRDVYYTPGRGQNAIREPYRVDTDGYFVQGDNSPVSSDSRGWAEPCVPHRMLLGKPFLVHLPSRPAILTAGRLELPIRVPDWSRIRYIR